MAHAQSLLQCEKCQILLVAENAKISNEDKATPSIGVGAFHEKFSRVFDLDFNGMKTEDAESRKSSFEGHIPINMGITGYVATTGATLNIPDVQHDDRYDSLVDGCNGFHPCSVLCMPIQNAYNEIIGVCQLTNKLNGTPFSKSDEHLFETFAVFYGMGIENSQLYEKAAKAVTKTKVILEVLSYHTTSPIERAEALKKCVEPSMCMYRLQDLKFNDFSLDNEDMLRTTLKMFMDLNLIERFFINYDVLCQWLSSEKKNDRPVAYHNSRHAFNLSQMMFACLMITKLRHIFGEVETLSLLIACLCHDLDHRQTNNSFQLNSCSTLAQLYSTSTMKQHQFDQFIMSMNSEVNQILSHLSPDEYLTVVHVVEHAILDTDLAMYFRAMLMTVFEIAAITKPREIQRLGMVNWDKTNKLPSKQVRLINSICAPIYEAFAKISDKLKPLLDGVKQNREQWLKLTK